MCACEGTGVIRNDQGNGCYQIAPCICEAGNRTPEEVDRRRQEVIERLKETYRLQQLEKAGEVA
ncbi:hypothetical protein [Bacillus mycoides]|uniref:hypothetical protein n=1 Tax=Bacillus mycoides TaxID=1405 RepID=UPI00187B08F8|nr:hypothetical protein [Bacillus mycoides]MBE7128121.1 hypothetical protein [Bacillus mycoides]